MGTPGLERLIAAVLAAAALAATAAHADPAAWRVAGANGGQVTLLGSVHVLRAADYPLPARVDELYRHADVLVLELGADDLDAAAQQGTVLAAAALPPGRALHDVVGAQLFGVTAVRARALGLDATMLDRLAPWFVAVTLLDQGMRERGFDAEHGLEQYLIGKAQADRKPVVGLETLAGQLAIFTGLTAANQQALLAQTLDELDTAAATMGELATAWRAGTLDVLSARLLEDFDDFPGLYERLVTDRNTAWLDAIERDLRDGRRYLVVVGALHLVGPNSVIDMLRKRGHEVERIE